MAASGYSNRYNLINESNPFGNGLQIFDYLRDRYIFLFRYLNLLEKSGKRCKTLLNDNLGPLQYLHTCSEMLFLKDGIKCDWDETKIAATVSTQQQTKLVDISNPNAMCCMTLSFLNKAFVNGLYFKRVNDDNMISTHLNTCTQQPSECMTLYMTNEITDLKTTVEPLLKYFKKGDNPNILNITDGYTLIADYMKNILCLEKQEVKEEMDMKHCTSKWCAYALILAVECIRATAVLFYPYLWQKKNDLLLWDIECSQYKETIYMLESACMELMKIPKKRQLSNRYKKELISMTAIMKDSTIRLGLGINIFYPLDQNREPARRYLANHYMMESEKYAICTYIKKHKLYEAHVDLNNMLWSLESLSKIKNVNNCIDHTSIYILSQALHTHIRGDPATNNYVNNFKQMEEFIFYMDSTIMDDKKTMMFPTIWYFDEIIKTPLTERVANDEYTQYFSKQIISMDIHIFPSEIKNMNHVFALGGAMGLILDYFLNSFYAKSRDYAYNNALGHYFFHKEIKTIKELLWWCADFAMRDIELPQTLVSDLNIDEINTKDEMLISLCQGILVDIKTTIAKINTYAIFSGDQTSYYQFLKIKETCEDVIKQFPINVMKVICNKIKDLQNTPQHGVNVNSILQAETANEGLEIWFKLSQKHRRIETYRRLMLVLGYRLNVDYDEDSHERTLSCFVDKIKTCEKHLTDKGVVICPHIWSWDLNKDLNTEETLQGTAVKNIIMATIISKQCDDAMYEKFRLLMGKTIIINEIMILLFGIPSSEDGFHTITDSHINNENEFLLLISVLGSFLERHLKSMNGIRSLNNQLRTKYEIKNTPQKSKKCKRR
jgi:hypothetical protein